MDVNELLRNRASEYHIRVHYQESSSLYAVDCVMPYHGVEIAFRLGVAFTEQTARENALRFLANMIVEVQHVELIK